MSQLSSQKPSHESTGTAMTRCQYSSKNKRNKTMTFFKKTIPLHSYKLHMRNINRVIFKCYGIVSTSLLKNMRCPFWKVNTALPSRGKQRCFTIKGALRSWIIGGKWKMFLFFYTHFLHKILILNIVPRNLSLSQCVLLMVRRDKLMLQW